MVCGNGQGRCGDANLMKMTDSMTKPAEAHGILHIMPKPSRVSITASPQGAKPCSARHFRLGLLYLLSIVGGVCGSPRRQKAASSSTTLLCMTRPALPVPLLHPLPLLPTPPPHASNVAIFGGRGRHGGACLLRIRPISVSTATTSDCGAGIGIPVVAPKKSKRHPSAYLRAWKAGGGEAKRTRVGGAHTAIMEDGILRVKKIRSLSNRARVYSSHEAPAALHTDAPFLRAAFSPTFSRMRALTHTYMHSRSCCPGPVRFRPSRRLPSLWQPNRPYGNFDDIHSDNSEP